MQPLMSQTLKYSKQLHCKTSSLLFRFFRFQKYVLFYTEIGLRTCYSICLVNRTTNMLLYMFSESVYEHVTLYVL